MVTRYLNAGYFRQKKLMCRKKLMFVVVFSAIKLNFVERSIILLEKNDLT